MKKLMLKRQNSMNNKGFSLVELIIVIAIMAVLIAVLAPQFIKYVEQSRQSSDINTLDELLKTAQVICVDEAYATSLVGTEAIVIEPDGSGGTKVTVTESAGSNVAGGMAEFLGTDWNGFTLKSTNGKAGTFTIEFTGTAGNVIASWAEEPSTIIKPTT